MKKIQNFVENYYVGLDLGVGSAGWAVTDKDYNLLRFNKKDMWGSRLFDEANTAKARRLYRSSRRGLKRKNWRLGLLRDFFREEIKKVDDAFFMRLAESNLYLEDKNNEEKFTLFADSSFTDIDFYKKYPTIYHLRDELVHSSEKKDIRLVYLALHHIFKSRGHFVFDGLEIDQVYNFDDLFYELKNYLDERFDEPEFDELEFYISDSNKDKIKEIFLSQSTKKDKNKQIKNLRGANNLEKTLYSFCMGYSLNLGKIFKDDESLKSEKSINFDKDKYEENRDNYFSLLGDDIILIDICKKIYDFIILNNILKEKENISQGMIALYQEHKQDLKNFKYLVKKYDAENYNRVFRDKSCLYENYLKPSNKNYVYNIKIEKKLTNLIDYFNRLNSELISKKDKSIYDKVKSTLEKLPEISLKNKATYLEIVRNIVTLIQIYDIDNYDKVNNIKKLLECDYEKLACLIGFKKNIDKDYEKDLTRLLPKYLVRLLTAIEKENKVKEDDKKLLEDLKLRLEDDKVLPKLRSVNNSVIPYQIHKYELEKILNNQAEYYSFLKENKDKIIQTFEFKLPYYVGPLNSNSNFAWVVRKNQDKILPWNFEDNVDLAESAEKFITRMINKCTYLRNEDVMPKQALIYEEYSVLNELNKVRVKGEFLNKAMKKQVFNELFKEKTSVSLPALVKFLNNHQYGITKITKEDITGIDDKFNASLTSYKKFYAIIGDRVDQDSYKTVIDNIIKWKCLYGDDKKIFNNKFKSVYGTAYFSEDEYSKILKLHFKGFGSLSKEFLTELEVTNNTTGEVYISIMDILRNTNFNLQELFTSTFNLTEQLNQDITAIDYLALRQEDEFKKIVDQAYVSPSVKRTIVQTLKLLNELTSITKKDPKKIFVEVARSEEESKKTKTRKEQIQKLYDDLSKLKGDKKYESLNGLQEELKNYESLNGLQEELKNYNNDDLKKKKLYLYFMQLGKCIYSGEKINLDDLMDNNIYDIDHIYPQSFTKDDSLDNIVLTKKQTNSDRKNTYPINHKIQAEMQNFWGFLKSKKLMSSEKYNRLIAKESFSDYKLVGFINRQLVSTRQSTKEVARILKLLYPNTDIVYTKAGNVSDFRTKYDLIKSRDLNDLHHAKDAYLNIVVGNVLDTKFTKNFYKFIKNEKAKSADGTKVSFNFSKVFNYPVYNKSHEMVWNEDNILAKVQNTLAKNTPNITKMLTEDKGQLFNLTINKKGATNAKFKVPFTVIDNTPENANKYGYYGSMEAAYFVILEKENDKGKKEKFVDRVLVMDIKNIQTKEDIETYFSNIYDKPVKFIAKLKKGQLIEYNGYPYRVVGYTGNKTELKNAKPLFLDKESTKTLIAISKIVANNPEKKNNAKTSKNQAQETEATKILILPKLKRKNNYDNAETYEECLLRHNQACIDLYNVLLEKLNSKIYENYLSTKKSKEDLEKNKEAFVNLHLLEKAKVLNKIIRIFNKDTDCGEIKYGKFHITEKRIRQKLKFNDFYIIHESVTGLFIKKIKI